MKAELIFDVCRKVFWGILFCISLPAGAQVIMFDDFNYASVNDPQLPVFNKWNIIDGVSGPPEGGVYSRNNISFIADPDNGNNKLMTLRTTVNGQSKAITHARIETGGFEYFTGTYAARVYLSDVPYIYKDANIQTFYTIVSSSLAMDGSRYSELDIVEYMAADKWGTSTDNRVLYTTSYHKYQAEPWAAWKTYFAQVNSYAGWHTFIASCTDGVNVKYWIDNTYLGAQAYTDGSNPDGSTTLPVYPRSNMQVAFANWIWNNVAGSSTTDRNTTMQADWVLHYKNQELSLSQINTLVNDYRAQGVKRRNLAGQTYVENPCTVPAQPGTISGNAVVVSGSSQTYSIAAVSGATSYAWTLPSGWSGSSTSTSIATTAGATSGTISVRANNSCGASATRTLAVTVSSGSSNLATNKPVTTSSVEAAGLEGSKAVDNNTTTRWASAYTDAQWIYVDLGANYNVNRVKISWEAAYGKNYDVQISSNATSWTTIRSVTNNTALVNDQTGLSGTGRYVRINGTLRGTAWGYSIYELEVYGTPASGGFLSRIEGESYLFMAGLITEACSEGGQNIGSFDANDWASYNITIPTSGTYKVSYRVSGIAAGKTLRLEKDNGATLLGTVNIPNTGNWQTWTTVSHNVTLPAGSYAVGLTTYTGGLNLNWFEINSNLSAREDVSSVGEKSEVDVFPNPVNDVLYLKSPINFDGSEAAIVDATGKSSVVSVVKANQIDVHTLPSGLYVLKLRSGNRLWTRKFIKQ